MKFAKKAIWRNITVNAASINAAPINVSLSQSIIATLECIEDKTFGRLTGSDLISNRFGQTDYYSNRLGGADFRLIESVVESILILVGWPTDSQLYFFLYAPSQLNDTWYYMLVLILYWWIAKEYTAATIATWKW